LISSCFNAQSAAAILALVSADAPVSALPGAAAGVLAVGVVVAGAAFVLAAGLVVEVSCVLPLFLQPHRNTTGRKQQISLGWILIGCS
jgi:hypothetical protein